MLGGEQGSSIVEDLGEGLASIKVNVEESLKSMQTGIDKIVNEISNEIKNHRNNLKNAKQSLKFLASNGELDANDCKNNLIIKLEMEILMLARI